MSKISIGMLAYNEGHAIEGTIREGYAQLEELGMDFELWLFDNCSTDNTEEVLNKLIKELPRLRYFRQPENLGYAFSTKSTIKEPVADIYVSIDGDGQYQFKDIKILVDMVQNGADIVYANRADRQDPPMRVFISSIFNMISRFLLRARVRDLNCGFRAMTATAAKNIKIENQLNFVGPEIYVRSVQLGLNIQDTDVVHFERAGGLSVFNGIKSTIISSYKMFMYILKLRSELIASKKNAKASECEA